MLVPAHIFGIPVEETLPTLAPALTLGATMGASVSASESGRGAAARPREPDLEVSATP